MRLSFLLLLLIFYQQLSAGTWVRDTLFNVDGSFAEGTVFVTNPIRFVVNSRVVVAGTREIRISSGRLSIELEPNVGSTPSGTSYFVRYELGSVSFSEFWIVPDSASDQTVLDVAVSIVPTPVLTLLLNQLSISGAIAGQVVTFDGVNVIWAAGGGGGSAITCNSPATLPIVAGLIAIPSTGCYLVATEGAASTDDVDTVTCAIAIHFILMAADGTKTVVIRDNGSNMDLPGSFALDDAKDQFFGRCDSTNFITEKGRVHVP